MKLAILDRDGVINEDSADYIKGPDEWRPIPGSLEAVARLNRAGYRVVVVTNQSALARGLLDNDRLTAIHVRMHRELAGVGGVVEASFFCPHAPDDECACRKPEPGLLYEIAQRLGTSLEGVPVVGDSLRDLQAAAEAGATPVLVRTGNGARTATAAGLPAGLAVFADLASFVDVYLKAAGAEA